MSEQHNTTRPGDPPGSPPPVATTTAGMVIARKRASRAKLSRRARFDEEGATTAEYAITVLAACGFAALLVVVLKSDGIRDLVTGVISTALGLGQ